MNPKRRRKCKNCQQLFRPDSRNRKRQKYCSKPTCRKASKTASQHRWLAKPDNRDYFRGPDQVQRVQAWRRAHSGYWRRQCSYGSNALQDHSLAQPIDSSNKSATLTQLALQDVLSSQPAVLIGLIGILCGNTLQDDIAHTARQLLRFGEDILYCTSDNAIKGGQNAIQTSDMSRAGSPRTQAI